MSISTTTRTVTGVGTTDVIFINQSSRLQAVIHCIVTGTVSYDLEYSINGTDYLPLNGNSGLSASVDATLVFPVHSIRGNVTSGTGTVKVVVRQNDGGYNE